MEQSKNESSKTKLTNATENSPCSKCDVNGVFMGKIFQTRKIFMKLRKVLILGASSDIGFKTVEKF